MTATTGLRTIREVARAVGVAPSAIRYWERQGLSAPSGWSGGQRRYDREAITELKLLRLCQEAGFTLNEIRRLRAQRAVDSTSWRGFVKEKIPELQRRREHLRRAETMLEHALNCEHSDIARCPAFQKRLDLT